MASPSMKKVTNSLERSLKHCSLDSNNNKNNNNNEEGATNGSNLPKKYYTLDRNSEVSLSYQWEQWIDLKTGKKFFINSRTGMIAKEDHRTTTVYEGDDNYSKDDSIECDSQRSYSKSSSPASRRYKSKEKNCDNQENNNNAGHNITNSDVLVVVGCKNCYTYYMVPKQQQICPKCCFGQPVHFDRSKNGSP